MKLPILIAVAAVVTVQLCLFLSALVVFSIINEINRKLPEDKQISHFHGHLAKTIQIIREYRRLYPDGKKLNVAFSLFGMAMVALIALVSQVLLGRFDMTP